MQKSVWNKRYTSQKHVETSIWFVQVLIMPIVIKIFGVKQMSIMPLLNHMSSSGGLDCAQE